MSIKDKVSTVDKFTIIEADEIRKNYSTYGNNFVEITEEDIAALKAGKVIYHYDGEYCTFVFGEQEENDE